MDVIRRYLNKKVRDKLFEEIQNKIFRFILIRLLGVAVGGIWWVIASVIWSQFIVGYIKPVFVRLWMAGKRWLRQKQMKKRVKALKKQGKKVVEAKTKEEFEKELGDFLK